MKKNASYKMNSVCGEKFLMAEGLENVNVDQLVTMNETAAFLWDAMGDGEFTIDELVAKLTAEYEVSADEAKANIEDYINKLIAQGIVNS